MPFIILGGFFLTAYGKKICLPVTVIILLVLSYRNVKDFHCVMFLDIDRLFFYQINRCTIFNKPVNITAL